VDFFVVLGAVSGVASIIGLLLPLQKKNQRIIHTAYGLSIALFASVAVWYWSQNNRVHSVERAASAILKEQEIGYTPEGFIQASLAFLEKNKDLYPDAYARAQKLCEVNNCLASSVNAVGLSYTLQGLLKGIGTIENGS
jgi:hypothetical protein